LPILFYFFCVSNFLHLLSQFPILHLLAHNLFPSDRCLKYQKIKLKKIISHPLNLKRHLQNWRRKVKLNIPKTPFLVIWPHKSSFSFTSIKSFQIFTLTKDEYPHCPFPFAFYSSC
jgi:hypothetical protein